MISEAIFVTIALLLETEANPAPLPTTICPASCGNLSVPFPFGTSSDCSLDDSFIITCNRSHKPPKPFLSGGRIEVLDISLDGIMRVASSVASDCHDESGSQISGSISELSLSEFRISSTRNKFIAIGCDTYALVEGSEEWSQMSAGCVSWCDSIDKVVNGTCSGVGCCQTSIPKGVKDFLVDVRSFRNHTKVNSFNPCSYAFVVENEAFEFSSSDLKDLRNRKTVPVFLDWSVGNLSCQEARKNLSNFACRATYSECIDSSNVPGYHCKCSTGYQGNPYLTSGCKDINECIAFQPCEGTCANLQGSYLCSCPKGLEGDGKKDGSGCHPKSRINSSTLFYIASGFMVPAVGSSWIFWRRKQKKVDRLRRNLFLQNGGGILEGKVSIFRAEDLKRATNNYDGNNVLHLERHTRFISYKGMLPDGRMVTITKCEELDACSVDVFTKNIITLSQFHHRSVVQLLGCCLETQVPLLVYEFFELDTLFDHIHDDCRARYLSWDIRVRIAKETARALDYMHIGSGVPIIHGDLSSSSILLHHGYTVKVHDYTIADSSLRAYLGTFGYLDSHSVLTGRVTVKSNVYSFGVILAELLTGKKVISIEKPEVELHLVQYFVSSIREDNLLRILDHRLEVDGEIYQLKEVAKLAERCLSVSPLHRPTMKEVVISLDAINRNSCTTIKSLNISQETTARRVVRRNRSF